jgi:hypothetical protein
MNLATWLRAMFFLGIVLMGLYYRSLQGDPATVRIEIEQP